MTFKLTLAAVTAAVVAAFSAGAAQAQITDNVVRIGVLNDQSGIYTDLSGPGGVDAATSSSAPLRNRQKKKARLPSLDGYSAE